MEEISAARFRSNCFKLLDDIQKTHKEIIITKRGKPVAKLVHIGRETDGDPLLGALKDVGCTTGELLDPVLEAKDWEVD